jgi:transposase
MRGTPISRVAVIGFERDEEKREGIMALSMDIRKKVMKAIEGGASRRKAATRFDIGPATAVRWAKRALTTGDVAPLKMGGDRRSQRIEAHADFLLAQIEEKPDMTIMELREKIRERHGLGFGYGTVWRFLARHGITRKKKTGHASEQEREDVAAAREAWFEGEIELDPSKLVFIDETSISTKMTRRYGWALQGERCRASVPFGHWNTTTLVAALRFDRIDAPMTIDGALDGAAFLALGSKPEGSGADALRGRSRCHGQCLHAQGRRRAGSHRGKRRKRPLSSVLLAGFQPDRKILREDQVDPATHRGAHRRGAGGGRR